MELPSARRAMIPYEPHTSRLPNAKTMSSIPFAPFATKKTLRGCIILFLAVAVSHSVDASLLSELVERNTRSLVKNKTVRKTADRKKPIAQEIEDKWDFTCGVLNMSHYDYTPRFFTDVLNGRIREGDARRERTARPR